MNSSPFKTWSEFTSSDTAAIYTFANSPGVVMLICGLVAASVVWFCYAGYRLKKTRIG